MKMYELLNKQVDEIKARLEELKPAHEEYLQLLNVLKVVEQAAAGHMAAPAPASREPRKAAGPGRHGTRRGSLGPRAEQVLGIIRATPGLLPVQISEKAGGLQRSNFYHILSALIEKGLVEARHTADEKGQPLRSMAYFPVR